MRKIFVAVDKTGSVNVDDAGLYLGYGGEHNAAVLFIEIDESEEAVFGGIRHYQLVFDNYISEMYESKNSEFTFAVPFEALTPPIVQCQVVGYKLSDGEPEAIVKSDIFQFEVKYSKKGDLPLTGEIDAVERVYLSCSRFALESKNHAEAAQLSLQSANTAKTYCLESQQTCERYAEDTSDLVKSISEAAAVIENLKAEGSVCNSLKATESANGILRVDGISPLIHDMQLSFMEQLLATGIGQVELGGVDDCRVILKRSVKSDGITPLFSVTMDSGEQVQYTFPNVGWFLMNLRIEECDGDVRVTGILTDDFSDTVYTVDERWQVGQGTRLHAFSVQQSVLVEAYRVLGDETISVFGKNLIGCEELDIRVSDISFKTDNKGRMILNGTSKGEILTNIDAFKQNFSVYLPAGTYTFSVDNESDVPLNCVCIRDDIDTYASFINISGSVTKKFTLDSGKWVYLGFYIYQKTFDNAVLKIQLESGDTATDFEPYHEPLEYDFDAETSVNAVTSFGSTATFISTNEQPMLKLCHNKDVNYWFSRLESAVKALCVSA